MYTLPKGKFHCGYCFVILTSFLIKAKDNLFLTRQSRATYTDALNNLLSFILSSILMTKAPKTELEIIKRCSSPHHFQTPIWVLRWSPRPRQSIAWGDPILLINLILFSSLEDIQWCTNWVLKAIRISVNVSKQIKQAAEWFLRENKFQLYQHRVTDSCQDYHNNIIAQKPVKNN